ncbi:MAG: NRDE family protein [Mangrovimonas sp.]|nr:NRDE family protein [Mangrovimonas sp.]MCB0432820.1 NRDE family protein [Mangrovimonas sp.]MCB0435878.1 NRDE family protein [Mangrovimonas sp.]HRV55750.1 NRDE family protein [Mangrovimonas sp.]
MCTVTLVPLRKNDFVLISNRDEAPSRVSLPPEFDTYKGEEVLFPKDVQSGGTWIGVSKRKRLICLLNGGFEIHQRKPEYRQSRGIVVKDLLTCDVLEEAVKTYNFKDIEPFTIILVEWIKGLKCYELVWDEKEVHFKTLPNEPQIWSSSTLYTKKMRDERRYWFSNFKAQNELNPETLLKFHQEAGAGNQDYGVIMDRGFVKTTSITRVEKNHEEVSMRYFNLDSKKEHHTFLEEVKTVHE